MIQDYFSLRSVTVGSQVTNLLKGVSLSFARKQVDKSTNCYTSCLSLEMTGKTNNYLTCKLVN